MQLRFSLPAALMQPTSGACSPATGAHVCYSRQYAKKRSLDEQICAEQWLLTDPGLRVVTYAIREDALQLSLFGRRKGNRIVGEVARLQGALQDISGQPLPGFELWLAEIGVDSVALRVAVHRRRL